MHERHNLWKQKAVSQLLANLPNHTQADQWAVSEQLKIRAIIHAVLLCKLASDGHHLSYKMVRDLERSVGKMDLPVRLEDMPAYKVFAHYVNAYLK